MKTRRKILCCQRNGLKKRLKTLEKVEAALKFLVFKKTTVTIAKLARLSEISKTWFYDEEEIREICRGKLTEKTIQDFFIYLENEKKLIDFEESKDFSEANS